MENLTIITNNRKQFVIPNLSKIDDAIAAVAGGNKRHLQHPCRTPRWVKSQPTRPPSDITSGAGEIEKVIYNQNNIWISNTRLVSPRVIALRKQMFFWFRMEKTLPHGGFILILLLSPIVISASMYGLTEAPILLIFGWLVAFNRLRWIYRWGTTYQLLLKTNQGLLNSATQKITMTMIPSRIYYFQ